MQPSNKKKSVSVKDKLDGNAIDLSLLELTDAPVRELAQVTRGTRLDLSNNKLTNLSVAFPSLIHLVELDLSKNQLKELPVNFGDLKNLKKLDLYSNQLQRLPVSFYQLKELRWLDLKNNPLVSTLAEAAGDCLDQKGCQEAARKVVKLMTVVHEELEKKRLKEIQETKAELNRKNEEDRSRENQARQEKKAEKDRKRAEAERNKQQQQQTTMANNKSENNKNTRNNAPDAKSSKKNQKQRQQPVKKSQGSSFCMKLFAILIRLLVIAALVFAVIFGMNWKGPLTLDNAGTVARRTVDQVSRQSREAYEWALPRLEPVREQWKHLSRFVADNGRNLLYLAWEKTVHYSKVVQEQGRVMVPIIQERSAEAFSLAAQYWQLICREVPIYYETLVDKVMQLYQGNTAQTQSATKGA